jgi:hypothetical protein
MTRQNTVKILKKWDKPWHKAFNGWEEAFVYGWHFVPYFNSKGFVEISNAGFTHCDVTEIIALSKGKKGEKDWIGVFKLKNGKYASLKAGCDKNGWNFMSDDNHTHGWTSMAETKEDIINFVLSDEDKLRLHIKIHKEKPLSRWDLLDL